MRCLCCFHALDISSMSPKWPRRRAVQEPDMQACSSMRHVVCGGEAMPPALIARCRQVLPNATLHNDYGPTEATIACTGTFQHQDPGMVAPMYAPQQRAVNLGWGALQGSTRQPSSRAA